MENLVPSPTQILYEALQSLPASPEAKLWALELTRRRRTLRELKLAVLARFCEVLSGFMVPDGPLYDLGPHMRHNYTQGNSFGPLKML